MVEWLRQWLLSITCAALIATLADALCPGGFPRKLTRLAGGLLLLLAALGPLVRLDEDLLSDSLAKYRFQQEGYTQAMSGQEQEMMKSIIAQQTAAYISDKAAGLGITQCRVEVRCRLTEEGFPAPETVRVEGCGDEKAWQALSRAITADFAVEESAQTLERKDAP